MQNVFPLPIPVETRHARPQPPGERPVPDGGRAARIARLVADVLEMPGALVDTGGADGPFVLGAEGIDPARIAAGWTAPPSREGPVRIAAEGGTIVAIPVTLRGRPAWVAGIGRPGAAVPEGARALQALLAELDADRTDHDDATAAWVRRLEHDNRQMDKAQRLVGIGTLTVDIASDRIEVSAAALEVLGLAAFDTLEDLLAAFDPFDRGFVHRAMTGRMGEADSFDFHRQTVDAGRGPRWVRVHGEVERSEGEPVRVFATVQDVTAERACVAEMKQLAEHDPLTGVYNRTVFDRAVREAARQADCARLHAALFLVDVDDFKEINDGFGQPAGDQVLKFVARGLTSLVRASDTVVRLAGDEFAVIVGGLADVEAIMQLAERFQKALSARVSLGTDSVRLSTCIGVAVYPQDVAPRVDVYKAADQALCAAKAAGRGSVRRFDPAMRAEKETRRALVSRVRQGLAAGEFEPFFQPKLDLRSGTVVGFEALCRWRHPVRGTLGPGAFLPAFEDPDVGGALSDASLSGAFAAARAFRERGLSFGHVAVNLNAAQLERDDLVPHVLRLKAEHGLASDEVVFEVLENVLIRDHRTVYRNLTELFRNGFRVALDDFGTGYASLAHIREPFIREVKIDRSFVTDAAARPQDLQIVAAIVQMARKLGLSLVAEGIENEETLRQLRILGCQVGQGFVFSEALPLAGALEFISRQSRIAALLRDDLSSSGP
jgi:diguanylate cyclase (GGDEF)-like protein